MAFALSSPCKLLLRRSFRFQRCSLSHSALGNLHRRTICSANAPSDAASTQTLSDAAAISPLQKHLEAGLSVVVLKRGKAALFRNARNPLVYGGAVERYIPCNEATNSESQEAAEPVVVVDGGFHAVGYGFYNPHSMFRVRLLSHIVPNEKNMPEQGGFEWDVKADIRAKIDDALRLREMLGLPNEGTNAFRIVNGDGDRLSGLTVDRYEDVLVVSSSALWCERFRMEIELALRGAVGSCKDVVWRRSLDRLRQDGFSQQHEHGHQAHIEEEEGIVGKSVESNGNTFNSAREQTGLEKGEELARRDKEEVQCKSDCMQVRENGAIFNLSQRALHSGQKTGHYTDQRENRLYLSSLLRARSASSNNNMAMLDLFCYTGGFGLSCALSAPNLRVTGVDSSAQALSLAYLNTSANGVNSQMQFIRADVSKFLRDSAAAKNSPQYDVIVLDPPKFAPSSKTLPRALRKYRALNAAAMKLVRQGGLLLTCSCSAAVTRNRGVFVDMLREAACDSRKEIKLLRTMGAAADHPVASELPETEYLTACLFVVQDMT